MVSAVVDATAKFVPPARTVAPSGKGVPGSAGWSVRTAVIPQTALLARSRSAHMVVTPLVLVRFHPEPPNRSGPPSTRSPVDDIALSG